MHGLVQAALQTTVSAGGGYCYYGRLGPGSEDRSGMFLPESHGK